MLLLFAIKERFVTMHLIQKQFDEIENLLESLKQESEVVTNLIIVEGNNDVQALQSVGIEQNIIAFKGNSQTEICDIASKFKKVIILTDFDAYGEELAKKLYENLSSRGIKVDLNYHRKLKFYFKKVSKDIEGLFQIYQQIRQLKESKRKV
jgi:5S rRNA maturation endonuclease (ribonuclease M5)